MRLADGFGSQADKYKQAAQKFRLPYFDYYRPRNHGTSFPGITQDGRSTSFPYDFSLPQIFTVEKVMLMKPGATALSLEDNPLNFFKFPSIDNEDTNPDFKWEVIGSDSDTYSRIRTTRYPTRQSPIQDMNGALNGYRESGVSIILSMIKDSIYASWDAFSTSAAGLAPPSGSLEDIHGQYHELIGDTSGHMSTVPVAAFDPVFFFHHW